MESEIQGIKQQISVLENFLPDVRNNEERGDESESAAVQLILLDKKMGWKAAFRKLVILTFGVETLGKSCVMGRKNSKSEKLDEQKLQHLKGTIRSHNLTNSIVIVFRNDLYIILGRK